MAVFGVQGVYPLQGGIDWVPAIFLAKKRKFLAQSATNPPTSKLVRL